MFRKLMSSFLAFGLIFSMFNVNTISVFAQDFSNDNLALNKDVEVSAEYSTMPGSNLTDVDKESRWSNEGPAPQWAVIDLGESMKMNYFSMIWESNENYADSYNVYVSNDKTEWNDAVLEVVGNTGPVSEHKIDDVEGRYVRLEIAKQKGYPSVSARDFTIKYRADVPKQDPSKNVALNKTVVASSEEVPSLGANKINDGDTKSRSSRWSSAEKAAPHWVYLDLGSSLELQTIKLFWETRKATDYEIQVADTFGTTADDTVWTTIYHSTERPSALEDQIVLDTVTTGRYVRLLINDFTSVDPDGGVTWNTISLFEMELYGGELEVVIPDHEKIEIIQPVLGDHKLVVNIPESSKYDIIFNGADYEHVVDTDLTIYEPIVDTDVVLNFKLTNKTYANDYYFEERTVTVPGTHIKEASDNASLTVLPELREWKGHTGSLALADVKQVVIADESLRAVAQVFVEDFKELFAVKLPITVSTTATAGDIYLSLTTDVTKGLKEEGYVLEVSDHVSALAEDETGLFWSTRTILQSLKVDGLINKGIGRDYPMHEVRSFILDVGRKTFTLDYLQQLVKEMSWYKLNDFQIHLNDNYIFLEEYTRAGMDPMTAYSGFRLESDIKEGGNGGLNKADLTNKDVFYTKDEFRDLILDSRVRGVNIVPEIDTPAHSLSLTKVRPDLRLGTDGRQNDHLDLSNQFEASIGFVKDIFNEYMGAGLSNPVFDMDTIVHVGADEFNANHEAYRRFADEMLEYVQDTGRTARVWGSLSASKGNTPVRSKDVQMNLWNFGYSNMDEMYEQGFDLINTNDGHYYIVPNGGYYYDYLNLNTVYNLPINSIGGVTIPNGDPQMIGGAFAVWNDMVDLRDNGVSEYDIADRINKALPLFAAKLWGKQDLTLSQAQNREKEIGNAPHTNWGYEVDSQSDAIAHYTFENKEDKTVNEYKLDSTVNSELVKEDGKHALKLNGKESYITTPLETLGLGNDLRVKVKRTSETVEDQILFESPYGSIKAVQAETGQVGLSRERFNYSFNYTLPMNEWVELEFKNLQNVISLYVNGKLVDTLGDGEQIQGRPLLATNMFAFEKIGSETSAFTGFVSDLRVGKNDDFNSTMDLDYSLWTIEAVLTDAQRETYKNELKAAYAVLAEYAPSAQSIVDQKTIIDGLLNNLNYEKADYSRVETYLALVPGDLSIYTEASVETLKVAIAGIRYDLPVAMQDLVNDYEFTLKNALHALELVEQLNVNYVDNSRLTATASSFQDASAKPENVIDGDINTTWHSKWSVTTMPHWINLELDTPEIISGLYYVPRQLGTNGIPANFEIQVSMDGVTFTTVLEDTYDKSQTPRTIEFDPVEAKHVRMLIKTAPNNNGSIAELKVILANVDPDVSGLQNIIDKAEAIVDNGFTETTWNHLQTVIKKAKDLLAETTIDPNDVETVKRELLEAILGLELEYIDESLDFGDLETVLAEAKAYDQTLYTVESAQALQDAIEGAEAILAQRSLTQEDINDATQALKDAISGLELLPVIDHSVLEDILEEAKDFDLTLYTKESGDHLLAVIEEAEAVLNNPASTQQEINDVAAKLAEAIKDLELIKTEEKELDTKKLEGLINKIEALDLSKYTDQSVKQLETVLARVKKEMAVATTQFEIDMLYNDLLQAYSGLVHKDVKVPKKDVPTGINTNMMMYTLIACAGLSLVAVLNKKSRTQTK